VFEVARLALKNAVTFAAHAHRSEIHFVKKTGELKS